MAQVLRDAGLSRLVEGEVETLADGFQFTEGPLWLPDGSILFQDLTAERTYRITPDRSVQVLREHTGAANGQTFDAAGRIIFCEQNGRRVSRMSPDGSNVETIVEHFEGHRLNSPNDIIARSDGLVFFTDPPYGVPRPEDKELPYQAVFTLDGGGRLRPIVHEGFVKPNGLALSPDEKTLYINDTGEYHVRAFDLEPSGAIIPGSGRILATFDPKEKGGPDGLKVDCEGRLYVAVAEGIWVLAPDGGLLGILALPKRPSNLTWADADARTLVITAVDAVHRVRMKTAGLLPPLTPRSRGGPANWQGSKSAE